MTDSQKISMSGAYPQRDEDGRDPDPDDIVVGELGTWAEAEARRRANVEWMEGVDSVGEMMSRRALPEPEEDA